MNFAIKNDGLLVLGRAGVGKSHIIKEISKYMGISNTVRLAYTNKATYIIDGRTIHSFLSLKRNDPHAPMSQQQVGWMTSKNPIVLLDEVSMLDGNLWFYLTELKRLTGCVFICFGDYRQIKPRDDYDCVTRGSCIYVEITDVNYLRFKDMTNH